MRRTTVRLAAASGAVVLAVLVMTAAVEVWVRLNWDARQGTPGFFLSDPVRGQRLAENYDGWFAGVPVHINSLGLRDPREYPLAKQPNTFRILVLGDSVTFGHGSVYEHTYPYLTEQRLKAWRPDIDWQVWNAAVPGYNTSQELAHLLEVGPRFQPDLVVVGFYENDLTDNEQVQATRFRRLASAFIAFGQRHFYSLELYKKIYLQIAWRLSASTAYGRRLQNLASEDELIARTRDARALPEQALTSYDRIPDEVFRAMRCSAIPTSDSIVDEIQRDGGFAPWLAAVRGFQALNRRGAYRIAFFLNLAPHKCPEGDYYYNDTRAMNGLYLRLMSEGTPAVSSHDAFLPLRPSQMPAAAGHSLGNANAVKAGVLFQFLRDRVLPDALPPALRARATS